MMHSNSLEYGDIMQGKFFLCFDETNAVYSLYELALSRVKPRAAPNPQHGQNPQAQEKHALEASDPIEKKGLGAKILEVLEKISRYDLGSHYRKLPTLNFNFDPEARHAFEEYRGIINTMLASVDMKHKMVEMGIHDGLVLFCELLETLLQAALCDRTLENDGQALAGAIKFFCESYILELQKKTTYNLKHTTKFRNILNIQIINDIDSLKDVIELVRNIHKPREAFHKLNSYFRGVNDTIRMQLTAFICNKSYTVRSAIVDLHPRYLLNGELDRIEETVFGVATSLSCEEKTAAMCEYFNIKEIAQKNFLYIRYLILEKNEHLLNILDAMLMIVGISGWLVFLTDKINLEVLRRVMRDIDSLALGALIQEHDPISAPYYHALSALNAISVGNRQLLSEGEEGLAILASRKVKITMQRRLINAVRMIKEAEQALGLEGESIINFNFEAELEQPPTAEFSQSFSSQASPQPAQLPQPLPQSPYGNQSFQAQSPSPFEAHFQSQRSFMPPPPNYQPEQQSASGPNNPPGSHVKRQERSKAWGFKLPGTKSRAKKPKEDDDNKPYDSERGMQGFQ